MTKKIFKLVSNSVFIIAFFSIVSRLLGLLRDRLLAANFGAGLSLDSYYAAFRLPDLIFNTLIFGALGSAFIPQFVKLLMNNKTKAIELANTILNILSIIIIVITGLFWILSPQLVPLFSPGFNATGQSLTIQLTRIMLFSIIFFSLSTVMSSILNSLKKFFFYSLAPVLYNLGIIFGIIYLAPKYGIKGVAYGVVLGSFMHFLIQLIGAFKASWHYKFIFKLTYETKRVFRLMLPRTIGLAAYQINQIVITAIASILKSGSLTIFSFANNIYFFPVNIFGISISTVIFPNLSQNWASNESLKYQSNLFRSFRQILYFIIPISIFFIFFSYEIIYLIFGVGKFSIADVSTTSTVLIIFTVSIFAQSLLPVITKAFYAQEDTKTPVIAGIISMIVNIILSLTLTKAFQLNGLAAAFPWLL